MKYLFISAFAFFVVACGGIGDKPLPLFLRKDVAPNALTYNKALTSYQVLEINEQILKDVFNSDQDNLVIDVPYNEKTLTLILERVYLFDYEPIVYSDKGVEVYEAGKHYSGKVKGYKNSSVTINIFKNDVSGIISADFGDLNIGSSGMGIKSEYIIYNPEDAKDSIMFDCASPDQGYFNNELKELQEVQKMVKPTQSSAISKCVGVDFELTYECYQKFGSVQATTDWFTSLFSGVKQIYKNEGIDMSIKSIYVWTTDDKYSDNPNTALNEVGTRRVNDSNFKGNFVHLVRLQSNNLSGLAWVGTLCVPKYRFGYSAVLANYSTYPAFSWSTMVVAHELGHNMGSQHTQWCGWTGGALDNCYATEGGCPPGPAPTNGGTIMSYCHMSSYGIKFSNGFGKQPGDKIRNYFNQAACINCSVTGVGGNAVVENVALEKPSSQSSNFNTQNSYPASKAFDGRSQPWHGANFSRTGLELNPWIQVDLGSNYLISGIDVIGRQDNIIEKLRLKRFRIFVTNQPLGSEIPVSGEVIAYNKTTQLDSVKYQVSTAGRYVRLWMESGVANYLSLSEMRVHGMLTNIICRDTLIKVQVISYKDSVVRICDTLTAVKK